MYLPLHPAIASIQLIQYLESLGQYFLVGGNFNAKHSKWDCISQNPRGKMLQEIIKNTLYMFISQKGPTYWPLHQYRYPDILDFFLTSLSRPVVLNRGDMSP